MDFFERQQRDLSLIKQIRSGDNDAMDSLLSLYKPLVKAKAASMFIRGGDSEDVIQEGMIGLFKAICTYNHDRGPAFASFASYCISAQITDAVRKAARYKHQPLNESLSLYASVDNADNDSLQWQDILLAENKHDPEQIILSLEKQQDFYNFIEQKLSRFEREVIFLYLQSLSYIEIADMLKCKVKSVDNALLRIRKKFKEHWES